MKKRIAALLCLLLLTGPVLASERFEDVAPDAYYAEAVAWAVDQGITNGMGNRQFAPDQLCTIGQALTFLWRACGSPEASIAQPFSDVAETDYYAGAAAWAYENGWSPARSWGPAGPVPGGPWLHTSGSWRAVPSPRTWRPGTGIGICCW